MPTAHDGQPDLIEATPMIFKPRPYQQQAVGDLRRAVANGKRAPLLVMPTGGGKTICAIELVRGAVAKGRRVLFIAPRRELIFQTSEKLTAIGIPHGRIMSGERRSLMSDVQVASIQTLHRRLKDLPLADLVIIDEAHASFSQMVRDVLDAYPNAVRIGMTATPARSDGRGLGEIYDAMVFGPSVRELTELGNLVPLRYFAPTEPDLEHVRITAGDYNQKDLSGRMNTPTLIGDVVYNWLRIAPERITVVFAVDRKHAMALCHAFLAQGIPTEYVDGETPSEERHAIFTRMDAGETRVLCSVAVVDMGWDLPVASCAVLARPTKSIARYLQAAGRVLRPHPSKVDAVLIDHTGAVKRLGYVDEDQPWTLDGDDKIQDRKEKAAKKEPKSITCPTCTAEFRAAPSCPECGQDMHFQVAKAIKEVEADLEEIGAKESAPERLNRTWTNGEKERFFGELRFIARERGYREGWAARKYRERLSVWPNRFNHAQPVPPSRETLAWIKHLQIKYAKSQAAKGVAA